MKKALRLLNVNKSYKLNKNESFQALYDINVDFEKGELVSIVGESGSGKSTLMNLIGGLDSDFSGQIIADGENLRNLSEKELDKYRKNKVGFVFQSFNLISHLSILDNVTLALTLSNMPEKEKIEKATKMLKRVGLETQLKKKPNQLSGGQKQRVAIARALINDPEIIIADEPTGALDSQTSMQILDIMKEIADSGKLVIMVTHSEKVASVSSRVVEIADGRIVGDKINENYQKTENNPLVLSKDEKNEQKVEQNQKKKNGKEKQNLSLLSAIRLSFHNMWASKVKNFLMAFGVAIGIGSLILMMSFGSGIDDFISNTMKSYSNPQIVTVTKGNMSTALSKPYNEFEESDLTTLETEINNYLSEHNNSFRVDKNDFKPGVQMLTIGNGSVIDKEKDATATESDRKPVYMIYTIPPYYTNTNVSKGKMCDSTGGVMFSKTIENIFEDGVAIDKNVVIHFTYIEYNEDGTIKTTLPLDFGKTDDIPITGIMDTSIMSGYLAMYIDYDYFQHLCEESVLGRQLNPNTYYIETDSEETTKLINAFLATKEEYSGSVEDTLAGLFSSMSSTIGTSLSVISSISLLVSAIMILVVLYMSVSERTKEIGVLKSIGARRKDIKRIFTSESFLIGLLSGVVGIIFNLILTLIVYVALKSAIGLAPISYRWWYFALAIGVSVIISMLSGLYPASKAAKLDPVESLRRE